MIVIHDEKPENYPVTHRVITTAFGRPDEANLFDALRCDGDLAVSLVAKDGDTLVGHIALSRMQSPTGALGLGPIAVLPENQARGIGSALIRAALEQATKDSYGFVFVLGAPDFYQRFGFSTDLAAQFSCAYAGPYFMALTLSPPDVASGSAVYAKAFATLS